MRRLVVDLDGTLAIDEEGIDYSNKRPNIELIARLHEYKAAGFAIIVSTSRNMRTYKNSIGLINAHTLPGVIEWLQKHGVPYDEIYVGKPWCGTAGFYVDDKAVRPSEFRSLTYEMILELLAAERHMNPTIRK